MRHSKFYLAFAMLFLLSLSANAQFYPVLSTERIYTPWDMDTTLKTHSFPKIISLTEDGRLGIFSLDKTIHSPRFYFYDNIQKVWNTREVLSDSISENFYNIDYTFGLKHVLTYNDLTDELNSKKTPIKWIVNYGDSTFYDSLTGNFHKSTFHCVTPSVYYAASYLDAGEKMDMEYRDSYIKSNNSYLYRMPHPGIYYSVMNLVGGPNGEPENNIHYSNGLYAFPIDSENVIVSVRRYSKMVQPGAGSWIENYTLLVKSSAKPFNNYKYKIANDFVLPRQNIDRQWFIKLHPSTKLYSSPRHRIAVKDSVDFGFIDEPLLNTKVNSEYANGGKEYYCLCNSKIDSNEKDKFLIYSIRNKGQIQKFVIPDSLFEFPKVSTDDSSVKIDSSIDEKQIIYADDSILYVRVTTVKSTSKKSYYSLPQVYKIHVSKIATNITEQVTTSPAVLPYPNPADETIRWKAQNGIASITDALGRKLIEVPASVMEADVSSLSVGVYFLNIRNGVVSASSSFVVAR